VRIQVRKVCTTKGPDPGAALRAFVVPVSPQQMDEDHEPNEEADDEIPDRCSADQPAVRSEPFDWVRKAIDQKWDNE
jgi:hypothetical protein